MTEIEKDKQANNSTKNTTQETKDSATQTPQKTGGDHMCSYNLVIIFGVYYDYD